MDKDLSKKVCLQKYENTSHMKHTSAKHQYQHNNQKEVNLRGYISQRKGAKLLPLPFHPLRSQKGEYNIDIKVKREGVPLFQAFQILGGRGGNISEKVYFFRYISVGVSDYLDMVMILHTELQNYRCNSIAKGGL